MDLNLTLQKYAEICRQLRLNLEQTIEELNVDIENKVLLINTGWTDFIPRYKDLSAPFWDAFHPYLLHPYLDNQALKFLSNKKVIGLGVDSTSLEFPLQAAIERKGHHIPIVDEAVESFQIDRKIAGIHFDINSLKSPILEWCKQHGLFMAKNLIFPSDIFQDDQIDLTSDKFKNINKLTEKNIDIFGNKNESSTLQGTLLVALFKFESWQGGSYQDRKNSALAVVSFLTD